MHSVPTDKMCVYACAGERGAINITPVTAHQLMSITYHTQHLKKETTFHLCLEERQLWKLRQPRWSLIKLRQFIWLSALGGRRSSQHSLSVKLQRQLRVCIHSKVTTTRDYIVSAAVLWLVLFRWKCICIISSVALKEVSQVWKTTNDVTLMSLGLSYGLGYDNTHS